MKTLLERNGYKLDLNKNIWVRQSYGGIAYNDGDEAEERVAHIVRNAKDVSVFSTELRRNCTDWVSLYHLGSSRGNILRPLRESLKGNVLEIGAGCGAITRFLGENGANVLALEGSPRRASIARSRTRDLDNVTVMAEKFDLFHSDVKFDVITLIGVLEYANLFTKGDNPHLEMLKKVQSLLKPDGKLIIAIENQLGLKYFAGAQEDHLGKPMIGIEGRYRKNEPQTFGKKALGALVEQAGFASFTFLAPFPDYKLAVSVVSEQGFSARNFDASAFAWQTVRRDPQLPYFSNFAPELAWPEIFKNDLGLDLANSFLVVASPEGGELVDSAFLAAHYSVDRIPSFCKETVFSLGIDSQPSIRVRRLAAAQAHEVTKGASLRFEFSETQKYYSGSLLSMELLQIVTHDGWSFLDVAAFLKKYLAILEGHLSKEFSGLSSRPAQTQLPGEFFDAVPQNIAVLGGGKHELIDREWQLNRPIELSQLLFRVLLLLLNSISRFGKHDKLDSILRYEFVAEVFKALRMQISKDDMTRFAEVEAKIQEEVTGRDSSSFSAWGEQSPLPMYSLGLSACCEMNLGASEELRRVYSSRSWKVTAPLRYGIEWMRKLRGQG